MSFELLPILLIIVTSYLLGSFPTAYLIGRMRGVNIFEVGSGNMGATNIIRVMGLGWGLVVWFFDSTKGIIAILLATRLWMDNQALATVIAAVCAIIGHNWSLFAGLLTGTIRGGKGAATAFGTLIMIVPPYVIAVMLLVAALIIGITRYVSLAVLLMFTLAAVWMIVLLTERQIPVEYTLYSLAIVALIFYRFRTNIQRLLAGTERRLGDPA